MTVVKIKPARRIPYLWSDLNQVFTSQKEVPDNYSSKVKSGNSWTPAIDLREDETRYILEAEIPGLSKDQIQLTIDEDVLTISGEKNAVPDHHSAVNTYCRERRFGTFSRRLRLNGNIDPDEIQARYENGVLTVVLRKSEKSQLKEIPVKFK